MADFGELFVVATPIGNLSDLSARAIEALANVDLVACEDTRRTRKLLSHLDLRKSLLRCDEQAENSATKVVIRALHIGQSTAIVTDAGSPGVCDPGSRLINQVQEAGFKVTPIPGPSAITTALSACGFRVVPFRFYGFLPRKQGQKLKQLQKMIHDEETSVFFESPYRILKTLTELADLAPNRLAFVARELTKKFEETVRSSLKDLVNHFSDRKILGEFTIVLAPQKRKKSVKKDK